ncbi:MAG: biotin transporter BioY [Gemmatimonadota bacterium]
MQNAEIQSVPAIAATGSRSARRVLAVLIGALVVAAGAQVEIPLPFTPVPVTLQGLAVVLVGAALGARLGAAALAVYVAAGALGLPVFAGFTAGAAKLIGPTGGYLLAFPVAALVSGAIARHGAVVRCVVAALAGMVIIFIGGISQLMILGATPEQAWALGVAPFLGKDAIEFVIAGLMASRLRGPVQQRL